jgi:hypothetical protein
MDPNGPTLRNADFVIATAFDKKWLGSVPRSKIDALRQEFRVRVSSGRSFLCFVA